MLPAASSGAPLAILAKAKIVQRPKITHGIKRPHERFMMKSELADATSGCESVKGRAAASKFNPGKPGNSRRCRPGRATPHTVRHIINNIRQYMSYKIGWCWGRLLKPNASLCRCGYSGGFPE